MFADNVDYLKYQQLEVELHKLIAAGQGDADVAEAVRERMEALEGGIAEEEIIRLNELSGDLSMTYDEEIPDPEVVASVSNITQAEIFQQTNTAFSTGDWQLFLRLLRSGIAKSYTPNQLAFLRSQAYKGLGEFAPAIAFMDEASRRDPRNEDLRALSLRLLWDDNRGDEAYSRARAYLINPTSGHQLIIVSGNTVARQCMQSTFPSDLNTIAMLALEKMQRALLEETSPEIVVSGFVSRGLLAAYLGDLDTAAASFGAALSQTRVEKETIKTLLLRVNELRATGSSASTEDRIKVMRLAEKAVA